MNYPDKNPGLYKNLYIISVAFSIVVFLLVGLMRQVKIDLGTDFSFLPFYNALCNTFVSGFLILALLFIKKGDYLNHKRMIIGAMVFSAVFLISYVLYHFTTPETTYCKEGISRYVYYLLLISHVILAGLSLPFILLTFAMGISYHVPEHKKMARWVFPVWLYVAVTGPLCYLMLKPCYPF